MACGTPVIGVREGGVKESVIDGVTGFLVEPDPHAIAARIAYVQEHPDARQAMSRRCVEYIRSQWTWQQAADRYEQAVVELLSGNGHAVRP